MENRPRKRIALNKSSNQDYRSDQKSDKQFENRIEISTIWVFLWFLSARLCSVLYNNINDCDETFNYWEPSHFLLYGHGFQTWEYSPRYSIRSYAYLWLYIWPAKLLQNWFEFEKMTIFYLIRLYLAVISSLVETFLYKSIQSSFGSKNALYYCLVSTFSAGMFNSTTSFLPSSFAIYTISLSIAFWLRCNYRLFIFCFAFGSIISWPFIAALGVPMAIYLLFNQKYRLQFMLTSIISAIIISIPTLLVDSYYYGKFVFAAMNIILYNVFSSHGPDLYGTEPFDYYVQNLFLNFNIFFLITLLSLPILIISWAIDRRKSGHTQTKLQIILNCSLYLWFLIFSMQSHKEERFMYPIYPLIALISSITLTNIESISARLFSNRFQSIIRKLIHLSFIIFVLLSISRILAQYRGYYSSMNIYKHLWQLPHDNNDTNQEVICLGKEWHRFPSNFFVPENYRVEFVKSEFSGQLPRHFETEPNSTTTYSTRLIPSNMNDLNQEEVDRYIDPARCDYIIDSDYHEYNGYDIPYSKQSNQWRTIVSLKYLDQQKSSKYFRIFYIPMIFEQKCTFINYNLLKKIY